MADPDGDNSHVVSSTLSRRFPPEAFREDWRKKRKHVVTACQECRRRRQKCSGNYPCTECRQRGITCQVSDEPDGRSREVKARKHHEVETDKALLHDLVRLLRQTHYAHLQCGDCAERGTKCAHALSAERIRTAVSEEASKLAVPNSAYETLFQLLTSAPESMQRAMLRSVRSGVSPNEIVRRFQNGDLWAQLAVVPEARLLYEFPYNSKMPKTLLEGPSPYLHSHMYNVWSALPKPDNLTTYHSIRTDDSGPFDDGNPAWLAASEQHSAPYTMPFHAAELCEPRLTDVKPSEWTTVCQDNELMRRLLQTWLRCDYHFSAALQKDLFLEDMASGQKNFCSALLVNAVLALACISDTRMHHRSEYWDPSTLVYRFFAEAKRLWELEATRPRITTIQAGIIFTVFHNLCGLDEIGARYRVQAITLANKIRLSDRTLGGEDSRIERGRAFTAWALYNWETLTAFAFMKPPLLKKPPDWQLPDPAHNADWYGEIWVRYPLNPQPSSAYLAHTQHSKTLFRIIMNEYCDAAFSEGRNVDIAEAYRYRDRLEAWFQALPQPLLPRNIVLPAHLQLHISYYHLIITIFLPFLDHRTTQQPQPSQIVTDSKQNLEILVRLYYLHHGFEAMDSFIVIPIILLGYDCIDAIIADSASSSIPSSPTEDIETLRSTLILAAYGLYAQRRNHYLSEALFCVLRGRMRPAEAALLQSSMSLGEAEAEERKGMAQAVRSHWPVAAVKKREEIKDHVLGNLVEVYGGMRVEE